MNNNIEEDYCSFEVSNLLAKKQFKIYTYSGYTKDKDIYLHQGGQEPVKNGEKYYEGISYKGGEFFCSRPTHALAIKWVRENFGIHIKIEYRLSRKDYYINGIWIINPVSVHNPSVRSYNSPEEATEAALLYTLNNLI